MISKERLEEIISNLVAWGQDHSRSFYECLMNEINMTDEELAELGLVYDYDGDEIESLVKIQKKLEQQKITNISPEQKNIKTRFNVGDSVYIVDPVITRVEIKRINITVDGEGSVTVSYVFPLGFSGSFERLEQQVYASPEEALEYLKSHVVEY